MAQTIIVEPPLRLARKGGIRDAVEFRPGGIRLGLGVDAVFTEEPCGFAVGEVALCYTDATGDNPKLVSGIDDGAAIGDTFGVYAGEECFLGPGPRGTAEFERRARAKLEQGSDRLVESKVFAWLNAATAVAPAPATLTAAIGRLDEEADANYIGGPIIWMSRDDAVAAHAAQAILREDGRLITPNGNPVVASSAFAIGTLFASGGMTVLHGDIVTTPSINHKTNREMAIAEQAFSILVDCDYRLKAVVTPA